jgi:hypothetical protein
MARLRAGVGCGIGYHSCTAVMVGLAGRETLRSDFSADALWVLTQFWRIWTSHPVGALGNLDCGGKA